MQTQTKLMPVHCRVRFTFHNIGQGLFYSGNIENFNIIYDCGSRRKTHANKVVSNYKKNDLSRNKLNLLIISHFHDDHTSGLYSLLIRKPKLSVDLAIIPYLSPIERLIISLSRNDMGNWYYKFLANPMKFLLDNGVKKVMVLNTGEPPPPENPTEQRPPNEERPDDDYWDENQAFSVKAKILPDSHLQKKLEREETKLKEFLDNKRLVAKQNNGLIQLNAHSLNWLFRFYNCKIENEQGLKTFEDCIKPIVKNEHPAEIISNTSKRRELRKCYKSLHTDLNNTSILLYHRPFLINYNDAVSHDNEAHLLTGDINLKQKTNEICTHFGNDLSKVAACLIPHHGSEKSWDKTFLNNLPPQCVWVVSSGIGSTKHPSFKVFNDITSTGHGFFFCHEAMNMVFSNY